MLKMRWWSQDKAEDLECSGKFYARSTMTASLLSLVQYHEACCSEP